MKEKLIYLLFIISCCSGLSEIALSSENTEYHQSAQLFTSADSIKSLKALERDINSAIAGLNVKSESYSIAVYSNDTKRYYYKKNIEEPLTPASTTKLVTAFVAMVKLGANFPVKTSVYSNSPIKSGIVEGDIFVRGHGDALLASSDIEKLAEKIKSAGIREIKGNIYADNTFFDSQTERLVYSGDRDVVQQTPPITAFSLEQNIATLTITSGPQGGRLVNVQVNPSSEAFRFSVSAKVAYSTRDRQSKKSQGAILADTIQNLDFGGPLAEQRTRKTRESRSGINVSTKIQNDGTQMFIVTGGMEPNSSLTYRYHISNPDLVVAGALKQKLITSGVIVRGIIGRKSTDENTDITGRKNIAEFSRPVREVLIPMIKNSDNYLAEIVYKMIGASSGKMKNNAKETRQIIFDVFDSLKIPCGECLFYDGSGLSRRNKITAEALIRILEITSHSNFSSDLDSCLAIAGVDGTVKSRMSGTLAENNLLAKTGTHGNVSALTGYVRTLDGERLSYAFMFNGSAVNHFKQTENELGKLLAQFFYFNMER